MDDNMGPAISRVTGKADGSRDPLFSVIVPVHDVQDSLSRCADSILSQDCASLELILVDDGSIDDSGHICDCYVEDDPRAKAIHKENGGVTSARNAGAAICTGQYVIFVDADDWIAPGTLSSLSSHIDECGPDMILFGSREHVGGKVKEVPYAYPPSVYGRDEFLQHIFPSMLYDRRAPFFAPGVSSCIGGKAVKRGLAMRHLVSDEKITIGEDWCYTFSALMDAGRIQVLRKCFYEYDKDRATSVSGAYKPGLFRSQARFMDYLRSDIAKYLPVDGGYSRSLDRQMAAVALSRTMIAVFHEIRHGIPQDQAAVHVRSELQQSRTLRYCRGNMRGIPFFPSLFYHLLEMDMVEAALALAVLKIRLLG